MRVRARLPARFGALTVRIAPSCSFPSMVKVVEADANAGWNQFKSKAAQFPDGWTVQDTLTGTLFAAELYAWSCVGECVGRGA